MSVLALLVAAGLVLAGGFLAGFVWAARSGQFDDTTTPAVRLLTEGDDPDPFRFKERSMRHEESP